MHRTSRTWPCRRKQGSMAGWHGCRQGRAAAFAPRRQPSAMRARWGDNDDKRSAAGRDDRRNARERNARRRDETLLKPGWLMRRLPPNTTPTRQATGGTYTTGPYSFLFDTPNPRRRVRAAIRRSYARCGMARERRGAAVKDQFQGDYAIILSRKSNLFSH